MSTIPPFTIIVICWITLSLASLPQWQPKQNKIANYDQTGVNYYCGVPNQKGERIVNGKEVISHRYPWIVKLLIALNCVGAGSLITDRHILTAAHAVTTYDEMKLLERNDTKSAKNYKLLPVNFVSFILGSHSTAIHSKDTITETKSYIVHPDYNIYHLQNEILPFNDIALATIEPVSYSHIVRPICLPKPVESLTNWSDVVLAGWGTIHPEKRSPKQNKLPKYLMETGMKKIPFNECSKKSNLGNYIMSKTEDGIMCLYGKNNTDACRGDSGGPVMSAHSGNFFILSGIVSWGIGCAQDIPSASTCVVHYLDWINEHTSSGNYLQRPPQNNFRGQ